MLAVSSASQWEAWMLARHRWSVVGAAVALVVLGLASATRYEVRTDGGTAWKLDRWTGQLTYCEAGSPCP